LAVQPSEHERSDSHQRQSQRDPQLGAIAWTKARGLGKMFGRELGQGLVPELWVGDQSLSGF